MISALSTRLVQQAPDLDEATVAELIEALQREASPLALAIARVVELVAEQLPPSRDRGEQDLHRRAPRVDPGIALPALAMACTTLEDTRLGEREREAARYEIETLLPVPDPARPPRIAGPDVPLTALSRGRRPRT